MDLLRRGLCAILLAGTLTHCAANDGVVTGIESGAPAHGATEFEGSEATGPGEERGGWKLASEYSLKAPFDAKVLRALASQSTWSGDEERRLMQLILHAGIEKDRSFLDLLQREELRQAKNVDLALSGYDYMLRESKAALDSILAQLATEDIGADVDSMVVLSTLDEWDRSIRAFRKHFVHTDGAGGLCYAGFLATRSYLYPKKYARMRAVVEAPVQWAAPLLPKP